MAERSWQTYGERVWRWLTARPWLAAALLLIGIGIWTVAELGSELREGELLPVDLLILAVIRPYHHPWLFLLATFFSQLLAFPYVLALIIPALVYLFITRRVRAALALMLVPLGTTAIVELLKRIFERRRPATAIVHALGQSFPSGHATLSVVIYGLLGYCVWRYLTVRRWARAMVVALTILLILATGLSRVYLEVHYPSDVLAGWAAGSAIALGTIILLEKWQREAPKREDDAPSEPK